VLAGTNRPDILDRALLRPGRFDRQITIDRPDIKGREQIFQIYPQEGEAGRKHDHCSQRLAALTPGFRGPTLPTSSTEAALIAARHEKEVVRMEDFESAVDRVIGGLEKKGKVISKEERATVAYHEAARDSWLVPGVHRASPQGLHRAPGHGSPGVCAVPAQREPAPHQEQLFDMTCMTLEGELQSRCVPRSSEALSCWVGRMLSTSSVYPILGPQTHAASSEGCM